MTLLAFAAERRAAVRRARRPPLSINIAYPPGPQQHAASAVDRWDRQTDGLTPYPYIDPAAHFASSVTNISMWVSAAT